MFTTVSSVHLGFDVVSHQRLTPNAITYQQANSPVDHFSCSLFLFLKTFHLFMYFSFPFFPSKQINMPLASCPSPIVQPSPIFFLIFSKASCAETPSRRSCHWPVPNMSKGTRIFFLKGSKAALCG